EKVPVKLHSAVRDERIRFHLLHKRDHVKLRQQMVCAFENKPVPADEQTKGFELEEGRYIILDPEEIEQAAPEESREIEVHEFVRTGQIDPVFLERAYYLKPDVRSKEYNALASVLEEMDLSGICTWTMRKRSYLGALQASGGILRLNALRYVDEVVPAEALDLNKYPLSEKELNIAAELINKLTGPFEPHKFANEHQQKLQVMIDKKARGERIAIIRPKRLRPTQPDKLLQALEASLRKVA
ncbi:MAG TPA: Ku protein, partial [Dissulfurispiraceae bacterium]|nr:Ku protein [Dissulfurispiraceae bacterium]